MEVFNGIQDFFLSLGKEGCYVLSLVEIAQKRGCRDDVLTCIQKGIEAGNISFNRQNFLDPANFTVLSDVGFLKTLTGNKWIKNSYFYLTVPMHCNEYIVYKYRREDKEKGKTFTHFITTTFDSKQSSRTVREGKLTESRAFTVFEGL